MPAAKKTKKRKTLSATCYAIRRKSDGKWFVGIGRGWWSFAKAFIFNARPVKHPEEEVVPCRVRPLPSAKRNRTRTR